MIFSKSRLIEFWEIYTDSDEYEKKQHPNMSVTNGKETALSHILYNKVLSFYNVAC